MDSGSVQVDFFLPCIAVDFMHVGYAPGDGFLNPFVHLVFILVEPVTAKDVSNFMVNLLSQKVGSVHFRYASRIILLPTW